MHTHLSSPVIDVGVGWVTVVQLWQPQHEKVPKDRSSVLQCTVGMGAHLPTINELSLLLLLQSLPWGNKSRPQVDSAIHKRQCYDHPITINCCVKERIKDTLDVRERMRGKWVDPIGTGLSCQCFNHWAMIGISWNLWTTWWAAHATLQGDWVCSILQWAFFSAWLSGIGFISWPHPCSRVKSGLTTYSTKWQSHE